MNTLSDSVSDAIRAAATDKYPNEMCGVIVKATGGNIFIELPNVHETPSTHFKMDAKQLSITERNSGVILAYVHSHPNGSSSPSHSDVVSMNLHEKPFVIVGMDGDIAIHHPKRLPLIGREYRHGSSDCYGIVRDYYARELGIYLKDYERVDGWWTDATSPSLYVENFIAEGFLEVDRNDIKPHDVLVCYWGDAKLPNHALIYLGDDPVLSSEESEVCVGSRICLHHPYGGLSSRFPLGERRLDAVAVVIRHRSLM